MDANVRRTSTGTVLFAANVSTVLRNWKRATGSISQATKKKKKRIVKLVKLIKN
jgi:hypothetical protein